MKTFTFFIFFISIYSFSQDIDMTSKRMQNIFPDNIDRYKVDYELKDYTFENGDSTILLQLDLESVEPLRNTSGLATTEVEDPNTGLIIVLYSEKKIKLLTK